MRRPKKGITVLRRSNVKIPAVGAVIMTLLLCAMCAACAYGYGGLIISVLIASLCAGVMLLSHPLTVLAPAAVTAVLCFAGGEADCVALALGALLAAVVLYAAFRRGADLTLAGTLTGLVLLAGTAASVAIFMKTEYGDVMTGLSALKSSLTESFRELGDAVSEAYGGEITVYDSDVEEMVSALEMTVPGMALAVFQLAGMLCGVLTAAVMRLCHAGGDVSFDGRWRCEDNVYTAAVYILAQIFLVATRLSTGGVVYYIAYNILLAFLPAALAMGVRALFTRRGVTLQPAVTVGITAMAVVAMCCDFMSGIQIIALTGSIAVLYHALATGWQKGMRQ
jgi:hypothetical protein